MYLPEVGCQHLTLSYCTSASVLWNGLGCPEELHRRVALRRPLRTPKIRIRITLGSVRLKLWCSVSPLPKLSRPEGASTKKQRKSGSNNSNNNCTDVNSDTQSINSASSSSRNNKPHSVQYCERPPHPGQREALCHRHWRKSRCLSVCRRQAFRLGPS